MAVVVLATAAAALVVAGSARAASPGTAVAWGDNEAGALGQANAVGTSSSPVRVKGSGGSGTLGNVTAVAAGSFFSVALTADGSVWEWGEGHFGQLGDNAAADSFTPVQVVGAGGTGTLTGVTAIAVGSSHTLALRSDGTVWAWGSNLSGQLGNGNAGGPTLCSGSPCSLTPVQVVGVAGVGTLSNIVAIAAAGSYSLALTSNHQVLAWGSDALGQLGNGSDGGISAVPVQVVDSGGSGTLSSVEAIAAGDYHALALKTDGTVWAWGYNGFGQLGNSTTTSSDSPVQVKGAGGSGTLSGVAGIAAGNATGNTAAVDGYSAALTSGGNVFTWGGNAEGELGIGTTAASNCTGSNFPCSLSPVQVKGPGGSGTLSGVAGISAGGGLMMARKSDGSAWTWGWDGYNQLGTGAAASDTCPAACSKTPVQVVGVGASGTLTALAVGTGDGQHAVAVEGQPQDPTNTSVSCTPASVNVNETTRCTAIVLDIASTSSTPTGTVSFTSDSAGTFSNPGNSCAIVSDGNNTTARCSVDYTPSATGTHGVTGSYGSDATHSLSSGHTGLTVGPATNRPTTTAASCAPNSLTAGQSTTCTATVTDTGTGDTVTPAGTLSFSTNSHGTFAGSCTLAATGTAGQAACQATYTPTAADSGTHSLTAAYPGDAAHAGSSGNTAVIVAPVSERPSLTAVSCEPSSVEVTMTTTCTATVTDAATGVKVTPSGSVTFGSDSTGSFSAPAAKCTLGATGNGTASCQSRYTPGDAGSGTHMITATYGGDDVHTGSSETTGVAVSAPGAVSHAQASFGVDESAPQTFEPVQLDASASVRPGSEVTSYAWTITGPGHYSLNTATPCSGQTPVLQTNFTRPGTYQATVRVTDSLGGVTTYSHPFQVGASAAAVRARTALADGLPDRVQSVAAALQRAVVNAPPTSLCDASGTSNPNIDATGGGGPPPGCDSQMEVQESLVDAIGCFTPRSFAQLTGAEKTLVARVVYNCLSCVLGSLPANVQRQIVGGCSICGARDARPASLSVNSLGSAVKQMREAFRKETIFYVSSQAVRINGLDYTPAPGAAIVIASPGAIEPIRPYVISSSATISVATDLLGPLTLRTGDLRLPIDTDSERIAFIPFNLGVPFLPGTELNGGVSVLLHDSASEIVAQMALPDIFRLSADSGRRVTVTLRMTATNSGGVTLSGFGVQNIDATIYGIAGIHIGNLSYDARTSTFDASDVTVDLFDALGKIRAGLGITGHTVTHLEIAYDFPPPGVEIAPATHLAELRGDWIDNSEKTAFGGGATLTLGPAVDGCGIGDVKGDFEFQLSPLLQVTVTGGLELACIPVGHEVVTIAEDGYAHFGASVDYKLIKDVVEFYGSFDVTYFHGHFTAIADAHGCAVVCAGGTGVISDQGFGLCLSLSGPFNFHWHPGFGFDWPSPAVLAGGPVVTAAAILANLDLISDSCGTGPWVTVNPRAADARAGSATVTLPRESEGAVVSVVGATEAPRVRLIGPHGQTIVTPASGVLKTARAIAFSNEHNRTTYVALFRAAAGVWQVQALDGSPIAMVRRADILADPQVSGTITGHGTTRRLRYRVSVPAGDDVRLFERTGGGTRQLAEVTRSGSLTFTPSDAAGARRAILALVERHGRPVTQLTIAHFSAPPPAIGRALRIRAGRAKGDVIVRWQPAAGAENQIVDVVLSDGRAYEVSTGPRTGSLRIPSVLHGERLTVLIRGYRAGRARHGVTARRGFKLG